ncbi:hypothetical protein IW262DRAFT_512986 [Armillaria fumosa]|nr:hypothetical protein IW262DRAFT_512986 [Armillaria fumosa]
MRFWARSSLMLPWYWIEYSFLYEFLTDEFPDMALLDRMESVMAHCAYSNCLYSLGNRHIFKSIIRQSTTYSNGNIASRGIATYCTAFGSLENTPPQALYLENVVNWSVLYSSLIMVTLLWCRILIIYRLVRVGGAAGRMRVYQRLIEMLVESELLYSSVIVVPLVLQVRNDGAGQYVEVFGITIRAIAPTILVDRVAAGHARPDDSWGASTPRSSLRFRNNSKSQGDSQLGAGSQWNTSSHARPDLEDGLEGSTQN